MSRVEVSEEMKRRTVARQWAEFDQRACAHFRALHGERIGWFGEAVVDQAAREGVKAAQHWGNDSVGGMLDYLTLVHMLGCDFVRDPQYGSWVFPWVQQREETGERLKVEHIIRDALEFVPSVAPDPEEWLHALDVAEAALAGQRDKSSRMDQVRAREAVGSLLQAVWPRRMAKLSDQELTSMVAALNPVLGALGADTPAAFSAGALLAFRFGIAFLKDPRYPKLTQAASEGVSGMDRMRSLIRVSRSLALYRTGGLE